MPVAPEFAGKIQAGSFDLLLQFSTAGVTFWLQMQRICSQTAVCRIEHTGLPTSPVRTGGPQLPLFLRDFDTVPI